MGHATPPHTRLKYAFQRLSTRSLRMDEDGPTDRPTLIEARVRNLKGERDKKGHKT